MAILKIVFIVIFLTKSVISCKSDDNVKNKFIEAKIVPDYIPKAPECKVDVLYPNGINIDLGTEMFGLLGLIPPKVTYEADPDKFYTLMMVGDFEIDGVIDLPGQFAHWLVSNIPGNDIDKGITLTTYLTPIPLSAISHPYRYVILVFEQKGEVKYGLNDFIDAKLLRPVFGMKKFIHRHDLGTPIAGNYFIGLTFPRLGSF